MLTILPSFPVKTPPFLMQRPHSWALEFCSNSVSSRNPFLSI
nr:MAG TPA: hypothetical protein [Caudoviricetes sp.]